MASTLDGLNITTIMLSTFFVKLVKWDNTLTLFFIAWFWAQITIKILIIYFGSEAWDHLLSGLYSDIPTLGQRKALEKGASQWQKWIESTSFQTIKAATSFSMTFLYLSETVVKAFETNLVAFRNLKRAAFLAQEILSKNPAFFLLFYLPILAYIPVCDIPMAVYVMPANNRLF